MIKKYSDYCVIVPVDLEQRRPLSCPVCSTLMRTKYDESSYDKYRCCDACSLKWAAARPTEWDAGWRPSKEDVDADVRERLPLAVDINIG